MPLEKCENFHELSVKQFVIQSSLISIGQIKLLIAKLAWFRVELKLCRSKPNSRPLKV